MMTLKDYITTKRAAKPILIMSHCVIGYEGFDKNYALVNELVAADTDIIELQFPFTDPSADGEVLLKANQEAVLNVTDTAQCFTVARTITATHPDTAFVIMTYFNIIFKFGLEHFVKTAVAIGIRGIIVPDLPIEEGTEFFGLCRNHGLTPIMLVTPDTNQNRMSGIRQFADGLVYCVARKGVTGSHTNFTADFFQYIARVKAYFNLPIGVGFGIQNRADITALTGKADIAIICSKIIQIARDESVKAAGAFIRTLQAPS